MLFCTMKSHVKVMGFLFVCGWKTCFCVTSSVEVSMSICGVYVILILKAWNESHKGRKQFDKAQCKTSSIYVRFSKICQYMALVEILYHWEAKLFYFRKIKSPSIFALRSKVSLILLTSAVEQQQHNLVIVNPCHSVIIGYNITGPLADHRLHCNRAIGWPSDPWVYRV